MRDFVFRAWDKYNKRMHSDFIIEGSGAWIDEYKHINDDEYGIERYKRIEKEYLMQYTGEQTYDFESYEKLKIFEGDILKFDFDKYENGGFVSHTGVVYFTSGSFYVDCTEIEHDSEALYLLSEVCFGEHPPEIIGNIYENSELLTSED